MKEPQLALRVPATGEVIASLPLEESTNELNLLFTVELDALEKQRLHLVTQSPLEGEIRHLHQGSKPSIPVSGQLATVQEKSDSLRAFLETDKVTFDGKVPSPALLRLTLSGSAAEIGVRYEGLWPGRIPATSRCVSQHRTERNTTSRRP